MKNVKVAGLSRSGTATPALMNVERRIVLKRKPLHQYPGGVPDQSTLPPSPQLTGEELNTLSYLVRKYKEQALGHLSSDDLEEELRRRQCGKNTST